MLGHLKSCIQSRKNLSGRASATLVKLWIGPFMPTCEQTSPTSLKRFSVRLVWRSVVWHLTDRVNVTPPGARCWSPVMNRTNLEGGRTLDTSHQGLNWIIFVCLCSVQCPLLIFISSVGGMLVHISTGSLWFLCVGGEGGLPELLCNM